MNEIIWKYGLSLCIIFTLIMLFASVIIMQPASYKDIRQDLNSIQTHQTALENYLINSQTTLKYINDNCKVTQDNNDVTILTCLKVKQ